MADVNKKFGVKPTTSRLNVAEAETQVKPAEAKSALSKLGDVSFGGESLKERGKRTLSAAFSGKEYLRQVFGLDLDKSDIPLIGERANKFVDFAIDQVANPVAAASAIVAPVAVPARLAASPLGRLAFRVGAETAIGAVSAQAAQEVSERIPENAPKWMQIAAPLTAAAVTGGASTAGLNRQLRGASARTGAAEAADMVQAQARAAGYQHMAPLNSLDDIMDAFPDHANNPATRAFWERLGIDPVRAETTQAGHVLHAYARQSAVAKDAARVVLAKTLPNGLRDFKIGKDGIIENLPKAKGVHWQDVLSTKDAPTKYGFTEAQTRAFNNIHEMLDEAAQFAQDNGVDWAVREIDGKLYFPRQARNAKPGVYEKPSNPQLQRFYEDATEAAAKGVKYADPEPTLFAHLQSVYQAVARQQLDDAIGEFAVPTSKAYLKTARGASRAAKKALAERVAKKAERNLNKARDRVKRLDARLWEISRTDADGPRARTLRNQLDAARVDVQRAKTGYDAARKARLSARSDMANDFKSYESSNRTTVPAKLFGLKSDEDIPVRLWQGKFVATENYDRLAEWLDPITGMVKREDPNIIVRSVGQVGDALRTTSATADWSAPFIQLLPLLAENPVAWGRASFASLQALLTPGAINRYIAKNQATIQKMVTQGRVPLGDVEFFTSLQGSPMLQRTIGRVLAPFERTYNGALLAARTEFWKALEETGMSAEEIGKYVRNATGAMDTAALGVGQAQRAAESLTLFSPKLLRSTLALVGAAMKPWTPVGAQAAHTILKLNAAAMGIFSLANMAVGYTNGETDEQIAERMRNTVNPLKGKEFLSVQVGDGWYGVGGTVRASTQMVANAIAGGINFAADGSIEDAAANPLIPMAKLVTDRLAPAARMGLAAFELATDEELNVMPFDYIDEPMDLAGFIGKSALPFALQEVLEAWQDPLRTVDVGPVASSVLGARTSPITPSQRRDEMAQEEFEGRPYKELTPVEKREFNTAHPELEQAVRNFASKEERAYFDERDYINTTAQETLSAIAQRYAEGQYQDRKTMRDQIGDALSDRATKMEQLRRDYGRDIEYDDDSDVNRLLNTYYGNIEKARINPNDPNSPLDFNILDQLESTLEREITNEVYGPVDRAREILAERTSFETPPELQWFFDNKKLVTESGYWDAKDRAFKRVESRVADTPGFEGIYSAGELAARVLHLENQGDTKTAARGKVLLSQIERLSSAEHRQMRAKNPKLDRALLENGYITKRITQDESAD